MIVSILFLIVGLFLLLSSIVYILKGVKVDGSSWPFVVIFFFSLMLVLPTGASLFYNEHNVILDTIFSVVDGVMRFFSSWAIN